MPPKNNVEKLLARSALGTREDRMLDVLRVLLMNLGALWKSELTDELSSLNLFKKEPSLNEVELDAVLERLKGEGLVTLETRIKASLGESKEDKLVTLADVRMISQALTKDKVLKSYRSWARGLSG